MMRLRYHLEPKHDMPLVAVGALVTLLILWAAHTIYNHRTPIPYESQGITTSWIPATVKRWHAPINQYAKQYDIDPNLIAIIMTMESGGNNSAKSEAGALGLMQITPLTAKDIASKYLKKPVSSYNLKDPATNIEFGTAYLAELRDAFGLANQGPSWMYTVELVAAGYNGGPGAANDVYTGKGLEDTQTVVYARDAFNMWRERFHADSPTFDRWKERGGSDLLQAAQKTRQPKP